MSSFTSHWLALREPADHRARDKNLRNLMLAHIQHDATPLTILDIGAGAGSNCRALAPFIKRDQHWILCDYDDALLKTARQSLSHFITHAQMRDDEIVGRLGAYEIRISSMKADVARDIETILARPYGLVTSAAFFDLAGEAWIERFCRALRAPLYTVLTYDGREIWQPSHSADEAMLNAFHKHQQQDKGLGYALGPAAHEALKSHLLRYDFNVHEAKSDWVLDRSSHELIRALAQGSAEAVRETGWVDEAVIADWLSTHERAETCCVGHRDLWAFKV